nr:hypothetical protein [Lachnospiraceae bacterium]
LNFYDNSTNIGKSHFYIDIYIFGSKYTIVRIDLEKNEMIFEKKFDCDGIQYIDNYVILQDPSYLEDSTVSLLRPNDQIFRNIENDEKYSVSDEGETYTWIKRIED